MQSVRSVDVGSCVSASAIPDERNWGLTVPTQLYLEHDVRLKWGEELPQDAISLDNVLTDG